MNEGKKFSNKLNLFLLALSIVGLGLIAQEFVFSKEIEGDLPIVNRSNNEEIRPTDVYYLALGIDEAIVRLHHLNGEYLEPVLGLDLRPRDVFVRALHLAEEYNSVHQDSLGRKPIDPDLIEKFSEFGLQQEPEPRHVYSVLNLMKEDLQKQGVYEEYQGLREKKEPSDVFHMLRQISAHQVEVVLKTSHIAWNQTQRVFEINFYNVYNSLLQLSGQYGLSVPKYDFYQDQIVGIEPRDVYIKQLEVYKKISTLIQSKDPRYIPIQVTPAEEMGVIDPEDVFDLSSIIVGELNLIAEGVPPAGEGLINQFLGWETEIDSIQPGDVYNLVEHNSRILDILLSN